MPSTQAIKARMRDAINEFPDHDLYDLRRIFVEVIREREQEIGWDQSASRQSWTDDQLRVVLSDAPTKENCLRHARAFARGYGSIEQIYRWAAATDERIKSERPDDAFVARVKRVAKQLGWRA